MRFPPIVRFRRICWFSKCSLQYSQTVCELTEAGIAFNKAVFWQCVKQKEIGVVVEVASTTNGELVALARISSAYVSEEWEKFGPVEIGNRAVILFTPSQSFQFVLAHQFTQSKKSSGFRFKSYRNLKRGPACHNHPSPAHTDTLLCARWGRLSLLKRVVSQLVNSFNSDRSERRKQKLNDYRNSYYW